MIAVVEQRLVELCKFPYPYEAGFTVASDIDSASVDRFRAVHALFCGRHLIKEGGREWQTLGLTRNLSRFDEDAGGIPGLGLELADSFFLIGDPTTFGMYRYHEAERCFAEDQQQGENCARLIQTWLKAGAIDSYHTLLHYRREQVKPLLKDFFHWCDQEAVGKPRVWINHSTPAAPTGLCPQRLQPDRLNRLARLAVLQVAGPIIGRKRRPLRYAFARYYGDKPGSPYYINDLMSANGLRYVWLNSGSDQANRVALPEREENGRSTILQAVTMEDGVRYYQFDRCFSLLPQDTTKTAYLRDSDEGFDASNLITTESLEQLCESQGTCILYTHWTHFRSLPISKEALDHFELIKQWRDAGKIWVTTTSKLLEWTRRRTFLQLGCHRINGHLVLDILGVDDPIFGWEPVGLKDVKGLCFRIVPPGSSLQVRIAINGRTLNPEQFEHDGQLCWIKDSGQQPTEPGNSAGSKVAAKNQRT